MDYNPNVMRWKRKALSVIHALPVGLVQLVGTVFVWMVPGV